MAASAATRARLKAMRKKYHLGEYAPKGSNPFKRHHKKLKRHRKRR